MVEIDDVRQAARALAGRVHRTPVLRSRTLDALVGAQAVHLKAESFQRTGSFKARGALHAVGRLPAGTPGVIAVSSGNHAQAVAFAAREAGISATIVMPEDCSALKLAATRGYGAEVVLYDRYGVDREALVRGIAEERGLPLVHPFDDWDVIAGQGTAALELIEDAGALDVLLACVSGGGLAAGCATVAAALSPGCRVIGVEPVGGDDVARSLAADRIIALEEVPRTICDGMQAPAPGERTFAVLRERLDSVVLVDDAEVAAAMAFAAERLKVWLEPSGAAALGALLAGLVDVRGMRVGVTLSGGNVTHDRFAQITTSAIAT